MYHCSLFPTISPVFWWQVFKQLWGDTSLQFYFAFPEGLEMLSTFSCIYWPSANLWKIVYSCPLLIFLIGWFDFLLLNYMKSLCLDIIKSFRYIVYSIFLILWVAFSFCWSFLVLCRSFLLWHSPICGFFFSYFVASD